MDKFSQSDPLCILMVKDLNTDSWVENGRTEWLKYVLSVRSVYLCLVYLCVYIYIYICVCMCVIYRGFFSFLGLLSMLSVYLCVHTVVCVRWCVRTRSIAFIFSRIPVAAAVAAAIATVHVCSVCRNQKNPKFVTSFKVPFFFQAVQQLRFELYDIDKPKKKMDAQDFLGEVSTTLSQVLHAGGVFTKELSNPNARKKRSSYGVLQVRAEETCDSSMQVQ
jgi:C2 domain